MRQVTSLSNSCGSTTASVRTAWRPGRVEARESLRRNWSLAGTKEKTSLLTQIIAQIVPESSFIFNFGIITAYVGTITPHKPKNLW